MESELPEYVTDRKGENLASDKLASKVEKLWQNPCAKGLAKVSSRHPQPGNLDTVMVPPVPSTIMRMEGFKNTVLHRERRFYHLQQSMVKASHILTTIADDIIKAEKEDKCLDTKSVVLKSLDSIAILAEASVNVSNMRRNNIRPILHHDIRGVCNPT